MAKKEDLIVGIDIGSYAVKVCQLQKAGTGYRVVALGSANIPFGAVEDGVLVEPTEVAKVVSGLIKNLKIKEKKVGISISGHSVIVKRIGLSNLDDEALAEYIKSEAEQYIPFDINEVYLDYYRIKRGGSDNNRGDVMLVAAKKEVVNAYINMLREIKLKVAVVDVDECVMENILEAVSGIHENIILVDIGAAKMNINILVDGVSVLARDIPVGSEQLTEQIANVLEVDINEAEKIKLGAVTNQEDNEKISKVYSEICDGWIREIKKTLDSYLEKRKHKPIESLVLSGGGAKIKGLTEYIQQSIGVNVRIFNPFEKISYDKKMFDQDYIEYIGPEMAIATGIALRQSSI